MLPIGPLMIEHRLIERMIGAMGKTLIPGERIDPGFIQTATDFIQTYADRCHHGKEEGILFRELGKKPLTGEHRQTMEELIEEHRWGRETTRKLVEMHRKCLHGDKRVVPEVIELMRALTDFYPRHIEKEDKHFFIPCMDYFTAEEKDAILQEGRDFDRELIHRRYREILNEIEKRIQA